MRPLHASRFTCMLRRLKASTPGKKGLNRSLIRINSLIPCKGLTIITQLAAHSCRTLHAEGITDISDLFWRPENSKCMESTPTDDILRPQHHYYRCQSIVKKGLKCSLTPVPKAGPIESTKSRAYGRHSAFAPFFASTWLHSLPYAEVSFYLISRSLKPSKQPPLRKR